MAEMASPDMLLPSPSELYEHLLSQLDFLESRDSGQLARNQENFRKSYRQLQGDDPHNWTLDITPNWIVRITTPEHLKRVGSSRDFVIEDGYAVISGIIDVADDSFVEYSLGLTFLAQEDSEVRGGEIGAPCCWAHRDENTEWRVAKRYHFDIDPGVDESEENPNPGDGEPEEKPISHLQSGGNFRTDPLPLGISSEEVHYCSSPLDKPRLPHPPMDPILLFEMISDQYGCPEGLKSEVWPPRIRESESMLWKRYYKRISEHLDNDERSSLFSSLISNGRLNA